MKKEQKLYPKWKKRVLKKQTELTSAPAEKRILSVLNCTISELSYTIPLVGEYVT